MCQGVLKLILLIVQPIVNKTSSEKQTVNLLVESRGVLYGREEEKDKQRESEITKESLYKLLQNMDTSINERLNTMNQSVEAKKKKKKKYNAI